MTRTPRVLIGSGVPLAACAAAALALAGPSSHRKGLVLAVGVPEGSCRRECCLLTHELRNDGDEPTYVCQWPGLESSAVWAMPDGATGRYGLGAASARTLERKYFVELKPGEALIGHAAAGRFPNDAVDATIEARYGCVAAGREYGIAAFAGTVEAPPIKATFR